MSELAPPPMRNCKIPCRFIPLNDQGETIDSLYRTATFEELEAALTRWLKSMIEKLEQERAQTRQDPITAEVGYKAAAN
jgi:hypothetical protein